jgi:PKD repeat protein
MRKYSPSQVNLDERVIFTLIVSGVIFLALTLLSFSYNSVEPCSPAKVLFSPGVHYTRELIKFSAEGNYISSKSAVWSFGDSSMLNGATVYHAFAKAGSQRISLTIDGKCTKDTSIYILEQLPPPYLIAKLSGPEKVTVGEPAQFMDSTANATKWEWRFGETGSVDATIQNPVYTFKRSGNNTVFLLVNGKLSGELQVIVEDNKSSEAPPTNRASTNNRRHPGLRADGRPKTKSLDSQLAVHSDPPPELKAGPPVKNTAVSEANLKELLIKVVNGQWNAYSFSGYLSNPNISVIYNRKTVTFPELCDELRNIRTANRIKTLTVSRTIDPATNRIETITVALEKKLLHKLIH